MQTESIVPELRSFIRDKFKIPEGDQDFNDDVHLFDYGYVDSFGAVELTSFIEKRFGVKISDNDLIAHPLNTVREISEFTAKRLKGEV
jgi:methoxymalonate biosynthesis acyl carrier protein